MQQFAGRIKEVDEELKSQLKSTQAKAVELYKFACLQSAMVFGLDNELIVGVDTLSNTPSVTTIRASLISITLNPLICSTCNIGYNNSCFFNIHYFESANMFHLQ